MKKTLEQKIEVCEKAHRELLTMIQTDRYNENMRTQHRGIIARLERLYNQFRDEYGYDYTSEVSK